mgnify:CR=1 FL=1
MEIIPAQYQNGYLTIETNGIRALIGTGVMDSMCTCGEIEIEGRTFQTKQQTLRITPQQLSEQIQVEVEALIGADILSRFDYRINPFRQDISFSTDEVHPYGYAAHFELYRSVPVVSIWIGPKEIPVFFNTASRISWLEPSLATQFPQVGEERLFYPGVGWCSTPLHRVLVWVSGSDIELDVGIPPAPLLTTLRMTHTQGILGSDIFHGPGVFIASRRREVIWFWHDY